MMVAFNDINLCFDEDDELGIAIRETSRYLNSLGRVPPHETAELAAMAPADPDAHEPHPDDDSQLSPAERRKAEDRARALSEDEDESMDSNGGA